MNYLVIPDVHGEIHWREGTKNLEGIDKVVFLGDYCDSFYISNKLMLSNLKDVIRFKEANLDKVILLWGNHDIQYANVAPFKHNTFLCSGYREIMHTDLYDLFSKYGELFQNSYQEGKVIFTHAGIQHNWFEKVFEGNLEENIADQLNNPLDKKQYYALHQVGYRRGGMKYDVGGIFWCDREELTKPLKGFTQVVGHTLVKSIFKQTREDSEVWFTDCNKNRSGILLTLGGN